MKRIGSVGDITLELYPHWVRLLIWVLSLDKAPFRKLMNRIISLWTHNGKTFLVMYLKECFLICQFYVSGNPKFVTHELPIALQGGLPSIIPGALRSLIRKGDQKVIRGVLSMLQIYRVLVIPGKLKLETITDQFRGRSDPLPKFELREALAQLKPTIERRSFKPITLLTLGSAGPNHSTSMLGI